MALAIGKVTILIGAGILGSVLAKEGSDSNIPHYVSGAFKIVWKQLRRDDSPQSSGKPQNDSLIAQVKDLQKQLKDMIETTDNKQVVVYAGTGSGIKSYGVPVFGFVVAGLGVMWWKGWKFSDMMFATKRGLTDACLSVGKQLDQVSSSVTSAKRHLSSRIDRVDANLDEFAELTAGTRDEVSQLSGDLKVFTVDVESVHRAVQTLESKIGRLDEKQDITLNGVRALCGFVQTVENGKTADSKQAWPSCFSRAALQHPQATPTSRTDSMPPKLLSLESPSSSSTSESPKVKRPLESAVSAPGLKVLEGILDATIKGVDVEVPNDSPVTEDSKNKGSTSSSRFGWRLPSLNASFLSRTNSATLSFK